MHASLVDVLLFLWTTFHDVVYLGAYWLLTHLRLVRKHRSLDERVAAIENHLGVEP
jgi:hypothetical protein